MNSTFRSLREAVVEQERLLRAAESRLRIAIQHCKHDWTEPLYDPIYEEGYTIPGDPPGTMGVDWRGPMYVEPKTIKRWTRECKHCGEIQETKATTKIEIEVPKF